MGQIPLPFYVMGATLEPQGSSDFAFTHANIGGSQMSGKLYWMVNISRNFGRARDILRAAGWALSYSFLWFWSGFACFRMCFF